MNIKSTLPLFCLITFINPAFGQTVYKCPQPDGVMKIQQTPCTITGGGETVTISTPKPSGEGLRDSERAMLDVYADQREAEETERQRQEKIDVERAKAEAGERQAAAQRATAIAAEEQAAAQRATANAILMTGRRRY